MEPRARLHQGDAGVALIEMSSSEPLAGTTGVVELTRAGTAQPALQSALELRARAKDTTVVAAQAALDLSALTPGTYMASAVLARGGQPFARISRIVEVVPGETTSAPVAAEAGAEPPATCDGRRCPRSGARGRAPAGRTLRRQLRRAGVAHHRGRALRAEVSECPGRRAVASQAAGRVRAVQDPRRDRLGGLPRRDRGRRQSRSPIDRIGCRRSCAPARRTSSRRGASPTRALASTSDRRGGTSTSRRPRSSSSSRPARPDSLSPARA